MNLTRFLPAAVCSFLCFGASAAWAQMAPATEPFMAGFLGQDYAGIELGYVRHHDGPPRVLHRYGFVGSRPMPNYENIDGIFHYNYTSGSWLGMDTDRHDFTAGLATFKRNGPVAPFLEGAIGWAWSEVGSSRSNSFQYQARAGAEIQLSPFASVTPSIAYGEARHFREHAWLYGVKAGFRLHQDWSASFTLQADDARSNNIETVIGVQRRF